MRSGYLTRSTAFMLVYMLGGCPHLVLGAAKRSDSRQVQALTYKAEAEHSKHVLGSAFQTKELMWAMMLTPAAPSS